MSEVKSYANGQFCWTDLATTDPAAAKRFYGEIFGWKVEDIPMDQGGVYSMAMINGQPVAAMMQMMPEQQKGGMPSHWNSYINVANVDEATKKATSLGGKTIAPVMDVMDVGRMSVIQDPSGAMVSLWQAKKHIGSYRTGEAGTPNWYELMTRNVDAAGGFYSKLFGWKANVMDMGTMKYTMFMDGQNNRAGMMPTPKDVPANVPSHWICYFEVANCDATYKKIESLKGKGLMPATEVQGVGRFAMFMDPQGAAFAILQPARK